MYRALLALSLRREYGVLIAKKCTAPCLQGVSTEFVLIEGRFYKLACDVFAAIVPKVFVFREGA